jgi:hypothetical protein
MPTATSVPATATAAATATPHVVFAQISNIRVDEAGHYIVDFKRTNMSQAQEQSDLLFYFGALSADNAPVPGSSWRLYTGATPFTDFTISRRPVAAYKLCVVANYGPGPIPLENSHCLPLPEPDP